ncbi:MAG TPA: hypothetical protein DCL54_04050 [Alphaproteobacteria bacterium]|nr:hypothetical protein [Alphaproteobacteria bacterium]HAJ45738.1 hypothetical protein [Alphaproteobacteria bacterium]
MRAWQVRSSLSLAVALAAGLALIPQAIGGQDQWGDSSMASFNVPYSLGSSKAKGTISAVVKKVRRKKTVRHWSTLNCFDADSASPLGMGTPLGAGAVPSAENNPCLNVWPRPAAGTFAIGSTLQDSPDSVLDHLDVHDNAPQQTQSPIILNGGLALD